MIVIPLHDNNQFIPTIVLPSSLSGKQTQPDIICPVVFFYPYERCYDFHPCYGFDESVYTESNITICYEEDDRLMKVYFNNVTKEMNSTKMFVINSKTINCGFEYVFVRNYKYSFQLIVDSEGKCWIQVHCTIISKTTPTSCTNSTKGCPFLSESSKQCHETE